MNYSIPKTIDLSFEQAVEKVTGELQKEGFGVLTAIDVRETFRKKLGIEYKKYTILGACNPDFAHKTLGIDQNIGLLLPCNIIVYEEGVKTVVSAFAPVTMMSLVEHPDLRPVAEEVQARLQRVIAAM